MIEIKYNEPSQDKFNLFIKGLISTFSKIGCRQIENLNAIDMPMNYYRYRRRRGDLNKTIGRKPAIKFVRLTFKNTAC